MIKRKNKIMQIKIPKLKKSLKKVNQMLRLRHKRRKPQLKIHRLKEKQLQLKSQQRKKLQ